MATWQFDCTTIPRCNINRAFSLIPERIEENQLSALSSWIDRKVSKKLIREHIPFPIDKMKKSTRHSEIWGDEEGNRIDVCYSNQDDVEEVSVRFDARQISEKFIMDLVGFLNELDCLIVTEDGLVIDPVQKNAPNFFFSILNNLNNSNAKKFVDNPEDFLKNLKIETDDFERRYDREEEAADRTQRILMWGLGVFILAIIVVLICLYPFK